MFVDPALASQLRAGTAFRQEPESSASANSATWAHLIYKHLQLFLRKDVDVVLLSVLDL